MEKYIIQKKIYKKRMISFRAHSKHEINHKPFLAGGGIFDSLFGFIIPANSKVRVSQS